MRGLSPAITVAIIIIVAIGLVASIYLAMQRYIETKHISVYLFKSTSPKCINMSCHIFLTLKIVNYIDTLYHVKSLVFTIILNNGTVITQTYGLNLTSGVCSNIPFIEINTGDCDTEDCYIALCNNTVILDGTSTKYFIIKLIFNHNTLLIRSVSVNIVLESNGHIYTVQSNSVNIL